MSRLIAGFIDRLFAAEDERARERGWEVRRVRGGRAYRDPRWDSIRRCACADIGIDPECFECAGTGVIRLAREPRPSGTEAA